MVLEPVFRTMIPFRLISLLLCLASPLILLSQKTLLLRIETIDSKESKPISYKTSFTKEAERSKELNRVLVEWHIKGYLGAQYEIVKNDPGDSLNLIVALDPGKIYKWIHLSPGDLDEQILKEAGYKEKFYRQKPFNYREVRKLEEKILMWCEDRGHPFATIGLDSFRFENQNISAVVQLNKGELIKVDSLVNRGGATISSAYLNSYLGIKPGDLYQESKIKNIGRRIKELPFVKERISYRVLFPGTSAKIELFLEKRKASRFDGILGLLPDPKTDKIRLTGDIKLLLINSFNRGERIELNWKSLQSGTQDLQTGFLYPYLFNSPIGSEVRLKLYKKDSTYLEVNPKLSFIFHLAGNDHFKTFLDQKQISLLNTQHLKNLTTLPPWADLTSTIYGIGINIEHLDYRNNPRKGYAISGSLGAGTKKIHQNDQLEATLYDGLDLNSTQYQGALELKAFVPIKNRSTFMIGNKTAIIHNEQLFQNELFRMGGLKSIRGFDEESIFASRYSIMTLEYRYLLEENSYISLFSDGAYYENMSHSFTGDRFDTPYSFGAGISFETRAGIFSISYALGSQLGNAIDPRAGKVHFGLLNFF